METSGVAKKLIVKIKPKSIEDLSAISALNRPGPLQAGLDKEYIINKYNNSPPSELPKNIANILKNSYWTLVYQEQVMEICSKIAGFTPREADDIRRAMGKKKVNVLNEYKRKFVTGCVSVGGLSEIYSQDLWENLLGFADYCLHGNTKILTENGPLSIKTIVKNKIPVVVKSISCDRDEIYLQRVSQWHEKGKKKCYKYITDTGLEISCTPEHKFLTINNEMVEIESIYERNLILKIQ